MLKIRLQSFQSRASVEDQTSTPLSDITNNSDTVSPDSPFASKSWENVRRSSSSAAGTRVLDSLAQQYEEMLRCKEKEISKLTEDLKRAVRGQNSIDSVRRSVNILPPSSLILHQLYIPLQNQLITGILFVRPFIEIFLDHTLKFYSIILFLLEVNHGRHTNYFLVVLFSFY